MNLLEESINRQIRQIIKDLFTLQETANYYKEQIDLHKKLKQIEEIIEGGRND